MAQLAEQLICNQQVIGSSPIVGFMDGFPSGQRGQTVNLLAPPSKVRILLHPFIKLRVEKAVCYNQNGSNPSSTIYILIYICRSGGTGRRTGLKILRDLYSRTGSIPVCGST